MRRSPDGGRNFPRSSPSGYRYEVAISDRLPDRPTTVPVFDPTTGAGRLLLLDLDTSLAPAGCDPPAFIAQVAAEIVGTVEEAGGRALVDASPSGGRHVYVLWAVSYPFRELQALARAFAIRYPVIDCKPMNSTDGQIRGPGTPHKSDHGWLTGYMALTCTAQEAERICQDRCGRPVWDALHAELAAELHEVAAGTAGRTLQAAHPDAPAGIDDRGEPYLPCRGGRTNEIDPLLDRIARTGSIAGTKYPSPSEARLAILASAAARGHRLQHVRRRLADQWSAIADWWRDTDLLTKEWAKAVAFVQHSGERMGNPVRETYTRETKHGPPPPQGFSRFGSEADLWNVKRTDLYIVRNLGGWMTELKVHPWDLSVYQQLRVWWNALKIIERRFDLEWGQRAEVLRAILRAVGAAAQMSGTVTVEFGCRQIAQMAICHHTTAAGALKELSQGPYALLELVRDAHGEHADLYRLVVPEELAELACRRTWRASTIDAIHPVFRVLGRKAAFAYEALSAIPLTVRELEVEALLPRSTLYEVLPDLAAHGLAVHTTEGWVRGTASLDDVAHTNGADQLTADHVRRNQDDRTVWRLWLGTSIDPQAPQAETRKQTSARWRRALRDGHRPSTLTRIRCTPTATPRRAATTTGLKPPPRTRPITEHDWDAASPAELLEWAEALRVDPIPELEPGRLATAMPTALYDDLTDGELDQQERARAECLAEHNAVLAQLRTDHDQNLGRARVKEDGPTTVPNEDFTGLPAELLPLAPDWPPENATIDPDI